MRTRTHVYTLVNTHDMHADTGAGWQVEGLAGSEAEEAVRSAEQAEADKRVAQALAEKRRALAVAHEQENIAEIAANRAKLVLAEAEVPLAIAEAFRKGNLGVMDYYRLRNIQADTSMRESIGDPSEGGESDDS